MMKTTMATTVTMVSINQPDGNEYHQYMKFDQELYQHIVYNARDDTCIHVTAYVYDKNPWKHENLSNTFS